MPTERCLDRDLLITKEVQPAGELCRWRLVAYSTSMSIRLLLHAVVLTIGNDDDDSDSDDDDDDRKGQKAIPSCPVLKAWNPPGGNRLIVELID